MIKLTITYTQYFRGEIVEDTYTTHFPDNVNIELEKHRIRQDLMTDSHVRQVYIKEEKIKIGEN